MSIFKKKKEEIKIDPKEKEYIGKLKATIDKIFEDTQEIRTDMDRYFKEFKGEWWNKAKLGDYDSKIFINEVFAAVMGIAPLITDNRPIWTVRARQDYMQKVAELYDLGLQYLWDKMDIDASLLEVVIDCLVKKVGLMKIYFDPTYEIGGEIKAEAVDPREFFIAPGYSDIWDAPFMGTRCNKPISALRLSYPELKDKIKPTHGTDEYMTKPDFEIQNDTVEVYEVWMRDTETEKYIVEEKNEVGEIERVEKEGQKYPYGKIVIFTDGILLEEKACVYKHNKPPYVAFYNYRIPHEFYGQGEVDQIEELNKSLNRAMQLFDQYMTLYCNPNWMVDANSGLDPEVVKDDLPGGGNVWAHNALQNPEPIKQVKQTPLNPTIYNFLQSTPRFIQEVNGITDISQGRVGKSQRQSATEISTLLESSYTRTRQRVRNFEFSIKRMAWLMLNLMQQFYTEPRSISIKKDNSIEWYKLSNKKDFMTDVMSPKNVPPEYEQGQIDMEDPEHQYASEQINDFSAFMKYFGEDEEVYIDFDIEIETNSSLPMDKQTLANLSLRLFEMKVIDEQAVLETLRFPKTKEILDRLKAIKEAAQKPPMPPMPPPIPQGQEPQDLTDQFQGEE